MPRTAHHRHTFPPARVLPLPEVPDGARNHDLAHAGTAQWVARTALLTRADEVVWVDGSDEQWRELVTRFTMDADVVRLDPGARPGSLLVRSPERVGRTAVTDRTAAGVVERVAESMRGRTMYVVPFLLGDPDAPDVLGVHVTDSPASVAVLRALTTVGVDALDAIGPEADVVRTVHTSLRSPRDTRPTGRTVLLDERAGVRTVWLVGGDDGSGVFEALRAHTDDRAVEVTLLRVHGDHGTTTVAVTGRTAVRLDHTTPGGQHVELLAAGPVLVRPGPDAVVARALTDGAVVPVTGLSPRSVLAADVERDAVFVDTALDEDGDVWWPGSDDDRALHLIDRHGHYLPRGGDPAAAGAPDATVAVRLHGTTARAAVRSRGITVDAFVVTDPAGAADVDALAALVGTAMPISTTAWGGPAEIATALDGLPGTTGTAVAAPAAAVAPARREVAA
ncbi:phosphoenolpyruvate carboxykinase domain-containing protein [Curtobacterium pusillum]|uniref:phosphoenolpyruvate carboxykinase domain-containing protein n=1 Tax=Curtobacterium pusillum TaxID=69373 RepID=UPI001642E133|nr:phosphoenolpyruvate carboxykinase domain-containing protein [Curtobacterium pusillum]